MDYDELLLAHPELGRSASLGGVDLLRSANERAVCEQAVAEQLRARGMPLHWSKTGVLVESPWCIVVQDAVRFPGGRLGTYLRVIEKPIPNAGVVILPVWKDKLVLIRHFRHPTRCWHWEFPRGYAIPNEVPEATVRREIQEELGVHVARVRQLGNLHPNTGILATRLVVCAGFLSRAPTQTEECEGISMAKHVEVSEMLALIAANEIDDGISLGAFALGMAAGVLSTHAS